ncbi:DUF4097 family beta strand repeat-containing protein [Catellatospora sp. NPDC049609]|uniref:DUF4097 family beta strand repeat-containing protein n=1 Tax=Catellatospora sp. NPDC049609 TaxID=3155505 RepID=UPI0034493812
MPTFDTPRPVAVTLHLLAADVRISASERTDTVVEVRPANSNAKSVKAAEETRVEYADGRLHVRTPKHLNSMFGRPGSIEVDIALPAGSSVEGSTGLGELAAEGPLGPCEYHTGYGRVQLDQTGPLQVETGAGEIGVGHVLGDAKVTTGTGRIRIGRVDGAAVVKSSNGDSSIAEITGLARINGANGDITVERALGGVTAKTAHGGIRIGSAVRGAVSLETAAGRLEIGIPEGTAAWLDLQAPGAVRNSLESTGGPAENDERVEVRARTHWGDIIIHRS